MKQFALGLITIILLAVAGFYAFRGVTALMSRLMPTPSPAPSASATPSATPAPSATPTPSSKPATTYTPTTKGGAVKGISTATTTTTTTTTTSHLTLTLVKTSTCPITYTTEIKDVRGPLTFRYNLIDNTSFGITIWNSKGEELLQNTTYSPRSGSIKTSSGVDYMKIRVESKSCASNNDNWLTLTAER